MKKDTIELNPIIKMKLIGADEVLELYDLINEKQKETSNLIDELAYKIKSMELTLEGGSQEE